MIDKFKKIGQFRQIIKEVTEDARWINGEYHRDAKLPVMGFRGTVKLHGTNAGVGMTKNGEIFCQSRNNIITPENDNAGFAQYVENNKNQFKMILADFDFKDTVLLYGEWAGKGIQSGVGISQIDKSFFPFKSKVDGKWSRQLPARHYPEINLYNLPRMKSYDICIDFNDPAAVQNFLITLTEQVESECPIAKHFKVSGIGEGIVWSSEDYKYVFKVKGEKHSVSKVKKLAPIDTEKLNSIKEFIEYAVTENRMNQGISEVSPDLDMKKMGDYIRWVFNDVMEEEKDTLDTNGLERKDIGKALADKCRKYFMKVSYDC